MLRQRRTRVERDWTMQRRYYGTSHGLRMALAALALLSGWGLAPSRSWADTGDQPPAGALQEKQAVSEAATPSVSTPPSEGPPPAPRPEYNLLTTPRLTGEWGGLRTDLEDVGVKISPYINIFGGIVLQGDETGHRGSYTWDLLIDLNLEKMGLIPGGRLFAHPKGHQGKNVNPIVGAIADPFDDADDTHLIYIDQLWYEQTFWDKKARLRFGYLDQQVMLDRNAYANSEDVQFMNTYLDNDNAIIPLAIGWGASFMIDPTEWLGFVVGAADGSAAIYHHGFDTAFHDDAEFFGYFQTELRTKLPSDGGDLPGNYRFGLLYDPRYKEQWGTGLEGRAVPDYEHGDWGFYLSFDQMLYREQPEDMQGLGWFCRYGFRRGTVNRLGHFWSTGLQYLGPICTRDKDRVGIAMYQAIGSEEYRRAIDPQFYAETGYELYYSIQATPWLTITPDLQIITDPGGNVDRDTAVVMGIRARMTF